MKLGLCFVAALLFSGCGGGCPPVFVPVYEVTVYDSISGERLCQDQAGLSGEGDCAVTYIYSQYNIADIEVTLEGYSTAVEVGVENQSEKYQCFDDFAYTTKVEIFLERNAQ